MSQRLQSGFIFRTRHITDQNSKNYHRKFKNIIIEAIAKNCKLAKIHDGKGEVKDKEKRRG